MPRGICAIEAHYLKKRGNPDAHVCLSGLLLFRIVSSNVIFAEILPIEIYLK